MPKEFLFVVGCPRSGTDVLTRVLSAHPAVTLGIERFNTRISKHLLHPQDFEPERFFDFKPGDTWYGPSHFRSYYDRMRPKFGEARFVGDKFPGINRHYDHLAERFPGARFIFIARNIFDIALSFEERRKRAQGHWPASAGAEEAVTRWNEAITTTLQAQKHLPILVVNYEDLFVRTESARPIADFLDLDAEPFEMALTQARKVSDRSTPPTARLETQHIEYICKFAKFHAYRRLLGIPLPGEQKAAA